MSETDKDCKYLQAEKPIEKINEENDKTWGNNALRPDRPISERHRALARLLALGKRNKEICEILGYTAARVSVLKSEPKILTEVARIRDKLFAVDAEARFKDLAPDALNVVEDILLSDKLPVTDKESTARWLLEKVTGKPAQQVEHTGDLSIGVFLDKLDKQVQQSKAITASSTKPTEIIDIEPKKEEQKDQFADWLDKNMDRD